MGEPGGAGGEILIDAWRRLRRDPECSFFAIDDPDRLRALADDRAPVATVATPAEARGRFAEALPILPELLRAEAPPGRASVVNAPSVLRSIDRAVGYALAGDALAVVTSPVDKRAVAEGTGLPFTGHTGYLAKLAAAADEPVMLLAGRTMRTVPVTVHMPLRDVPERLTARAIVHAGAVTAECLRKRFGVSRPRLRVAGLNPHAGEGGLLGSEERDVIDPAVRALRASGVDAEGPFPADSLFRPPLAFDAALCMYHDQALIPVKSAGPCVNVTLGLPFVRTSPGHGTAYDIAGSGGADSTAMVEAIRLAGSMARRAA